MSQTTLQIQFELLDVLSQQLNKLAYEWRSTKDEDAAHHYQVVLRCMLALGYDEPLDADSELPDEYLPEEYLALHS